MRVALAMIILLALAACAPPSTRVAPVLELAPGREDVSLKADTSNDSILIEIRSEGGIGSATVKLLSDDMPSRLVLRLYLHGMEELRFTYDDMTVQASVSSQQGNAITETVVRKGQATESFTITPSSPFWMAIDLVSITDTPAIVPLANGYFEVAAPATYLTSSHRQFTVHWVDFYR